MFWTSFLHYTLQISPPWHSCMSMVLCILKTALLRIWVTPLTESCLCVQKSSLSCLYHPFKGSIPKPELGSPPRKKTGSKSVSGPCRLSTISEQEPDMLDTNPSSHDSWGGSEWAGSSFSMCSDKFKNSSSRFSSDDSYQPDSGGITCSLSTIVDVIKLRSPETFNLLLYIFFALSLPPDDCAALLLACLHCRFHELMVLLPDTCERAVSRCFPSYKYIKSSGERDQQEKDFCNYKLDMDCNCYGSCQDTGELIELAMEISEVCYRWEMSSAFHLWPENTTGSL